jgi:hypothetical protein
MDRIARLHAAGVAYDVVDERTVEDAAVSDSTGVAIGASRYGRVLIDPACQLSATAMEVIGSAETAWPVGSGAVPTPVAVLPGERIDVEWQLREYPMNSLVVESAVQSDGWYSGVVEARGLTEPIGAHLVFADTIERVMVNGAPLEMKPSEEGSRVSVTIGNGATTVQFSAAGLRSTPRLWLEGVFAVASSDSYREGPRSTIATRGGFVVVPPHGKVVGELVEAGYPFLREPLRLRAEVQAAGGRSIRFSGTFADAIGLSVDGRWVGWSWPSDNDWTIEIPTELEFGAGEHVIDIELIPNAFNYFGPHHYYGGDWFVVSPDQIAGRRNFADPVDAPEYTLVDEWHFRPFAAPVSLEVVTQSSGGDRGRVS